MLVGKAITCNNKSIDLYAPILKNLLINNSLFSYYSYPCETNYPILGMDFISNHVSNICFENSKLTLTNKEKIDLIISDQPDNPQINCVKKIERINAQINRRTVSEVNKLSEDEFYKLFDK